MIARISALGLDIGTKRIGIAGCDGTGLIATGIMTLDRASFRDDVTQFQNLVQDRQVQILVAGLPYTLNGDIGPQALRVQKYAQRLAETLALPLEYVDERFTSVEAENLMKIAKISTAKHKGLIDRKAAALILQYWLDDQRLKQEKLANL